MSKLKNLNAEELKQGKLSAENIAKKIVATFKDQFFNLAEMRKNMWSYNNTAHRSMPTKMSWKEAADYIAAIRKHGMVEDHPDKKDHFRVRMDPEHRIAFFEDWKLRLVEEISNINFTVQLIRIDQEQNSVPASEGKKSKAAAPKKAAAKKAAAPGSSASKSKTVKK